MNEHPLKEYRKLTGKTLESVARQVGVTAATISRIECRKMTPRLKLAGKLSHATGLPLDTFLPEETAA